MAIDTVGLRLFDSACSPARLAPVLGNVALVTTDGQQYLRGRISNLRLSVREGVLTTSGSLAKWLNGENTSNTTRKDVRDAVESLSDSLGLNMAQATVTRLDIGLNANMSHSPASYLGVLGEPPRMLRTVTGKSTLYLKNQSFCMAVYDKGRETNQNDAHLLRAEVRWLKAVAKQLKRESLLAGDLYQPILYSGLLGLWRNRLQAIPEIAQYRFRPGIRLSGLKGLHAAGLVCLLETYGQDRVCQMLESARQVGALSSKQLTNCKARIRDLAAESSYVEASPLRDEFNQTIERLFNDNLSLSL